jgi:hypothetical protein
LTCFEHTRGRRQAYATSLTVADYRRFMPTWGATIGGILASAILAVAATWFLLRERRAAVLSATAAAALLGPLLWDLILRHTGGDFFVDAPGYVFPVSFEDAGSGVFATAIAALLLGLGPLRADSGRRVALNALVCGLAALLVDIYLY